MKIKWQPIVKAKTSVLFQWFIFEGHKEKYFLDSLGVNASLLNGKIVSDEIFIDVNEWAELGKKFAFIVESDKKFLKRFIKLCYQYSRQLIKISKDFGNKKKLGELNKTQLLELHQSYQEAVLKLMPFMNATLVLDGILKEKISKVIIKDLDIKNKNDQDLLLSKLIIPKKKSFFVEENEMILDMALKKRANKNTDLSQDIRDYLNKFAWMKSIAYLGNFQEEKDVKNKLNELVKENLNERVKEAKRINKETKDSFNEAFSQIEKSPKLVRLIDFAREFIFLQTYRIDIFFKAHYHVYNFLKVISHRLGLTINELVYLTGDEIVNFLSGKLKFDKKEIADRLSDYALIEEGGKFTLLSGNQVKKVVSKVVKEVEVKGTVANRGRATGKAKFVCEVEDIPKVNKGDIIISPMTHPKLVPAIIKSSGIVTDFGGMLCHAAIISREFGIPCLVGTKNATKVFKDGDVVELNAYEGVARKLK